MKTICGLRPQTVACLFYFLCAGLIYSQITARMPALKAQTGIDESGIGMALLSLGCGAIVGFVTIGFVSRYVQSKHLIRVALVTLLGVLALLTFASNIFWLCGSFALMGFGFSWLEVACNTQAINLEIVYNCSYLASMHATYSMGALSGSLLGSAFAFAGVALGTNFISAMVLLFVLFLLIGQQLISDQNNTSVSDTDAAATKADAASIVADAANTAETEEGVHTYRQNDARLHDDKTKLTANQTSTVRRGIPFFIIACGFLSLCAYCAEGVVAEWGGLLMTTDKYASEGVAALVYGCFSLFMATARFSSNVIKRYLGDFQLLFGSLLLALCCELVVITVDNPYVCLVAFAFMGVGLAPVMPIILSRAGRYPGVRPALASTVISMLAYSGMLVIPPVLGYVAAHFGLERAFLIPLTAICIVLGGSFLFRKPQQGTEAQHSK